MKEYYLLAIKIFLRYFIILWVINLLFSLFINFIDVDLTEGNYAFYFNFVYFSLHLLILFLFIRDFYKKQPLLFASGNFFRIDYKIDFGSLLIGMGIGSIFPLITNSAIYLDNVTMLKDSAELALKSYQDFFNDFSASEMIVHFILTTLLLNIFREIFFRGILQRLMHQDETITKTTVQLALLFTLTFFYYQFNHLDFISLFVLSVFLSFVTFKTKSIVPAIVMSIGYDLPVYFLYISGVSGNLEYYLTFQESLVIFYLAIVGIAYAGYKMIEIRLENV